jgi:hypothetical protein
MNRDMSQDRRNFIRGFGATLGSLIVSGSLSGCGPRRAGTLSDAKDRDARILSAPEWGQLRQCWLGLKTVNEEIAEYFRQNWDRISGMAWRERIAEEEAVPRKRAATHQQLLDALVARGLLEEPVARHMQVAFEEAIYHPIRSRKTCYIGIDTAYAPRRDLLQQADVLNKVSEDLDPSTVAKAQAAIAQDIAFFETFATFGTFTTFGTARVSKARRDNRVQLEEDYRTGNLEASPEALEAARLLTRLFSEKPD